MVQPPTQPLTVAEAKQQLRGAAEQIGIDDYIRRYPFIALSLAFGGGILLSDKRFRDPLIRYALSYLSPKSECS